MREETYEETVLRIEEELRDVIENDVEMTEILSDSEIDYVRAAVEAIDGLREGFQMRLTELED